MPKVAMLERKFTIAVAPKKVEPEPEPETPKEDSSMGDKTE